MDYSLPAWIGALVGTVIAVAIYVPTIRVIEGQLRRQAPAAATPEERTAQEEKLSIVRRLILGLTIGILATLGYWLGRKAGGMRG